MNVPVQARFFVYDLFTCVYAHVRVCMCPYRPVSVCTPRARVCTPLARVHVPVPARFRVYALCGHVCIRT